jgi:hypothetical protein
VVAAVKERYFNVTSYLPARISLPDMRQRSTLACPGNTDCDTLRGKYTINAMPAPPAIEQITYLVITPTHKSAFIS